MGYLIEQLCYDFFRFISNFACLSCDGKWEEHLVLYEDEELRKGLFRVWIIKFLANLVIQIKTKKYSCTYESICAMAIDKFLYL